MVTSCFISVISINSLLSTAADIYRTLRTRQTEADAALPVFDLRPFQSPTSHDFHRFTSPHGTTSATDGVYS